MKVPSVNISNSIDTLHLISAKFSLKMQKSWLTVSIEKGYPFLRKFSLRTGSQRLIKIWYEVGRCYIVSSSYDCLSCVLLSLAVISHDAVFCWNPTLFQVLTEQQNHIFFCAHDLFTSLTTYTCYITSYQPYTSWVPEMETRKPHNLQFLSWLTKISILFLNF